MPDSEAELAAVADLIEVAHVELVHVMGTRAVQPRVRSILDKLAVGALRRGDPDSQPTPLRSPRVAVDAPRASERKTAPGSPAAKRARRR